MYYLFTPNNHNNTPRTISFYQLPNMRVVKIKKSYKIIYVEAIRLPSYYTIVSNFSNIESEFQGPSRGFQTFFLIHSFLAIRLCNPLHQVELQFLY